jgi:peptide/nickel transport system substrate-binding protein
MMARRTLAAIRLAGVKPVGIRLPVIKLTGVALAAACVSAACAGGGPAPCTEAPAPIVRIAMFNPMAPQIPNRDAFPPTIFSGATLLGLDTRGRLLPTLVRDWQTADHRTWTLLLRDKLTTHDGAPLTASRVRDWLLESARPMAAFHPVWRDLLGIDAPSPTTIVIRLSRPSSALLEALATMISNGAGPRTSIDAGAFRLTREQPDEMDFEPFPAFWGGRPAFSGLHTRFYPSQRIAWAAFTRNEADVLLHVPEDVLPLVAQDPSVRLLKGLSRHVYALGFQQRHPVLRDARVRQALNLAIDRDELARRFFPLSEKAERGPFSADYWAVEDAGPSWRYDPAAARALLAKVTADGRKPLELVCLTTNQVASIADVAAAIEAQLQRVHVRLKLVTLPNAELYPRLERGDYDVFVMTMATGATNLWPYIFWHSGTPKPQLRSGYAAADAALDALYEATSPQAERAAAHAVLDVMRRDPPAAFLGPFTFIGAVRRTWTVPPGEQGLVSSLPRWTHTPVCGGS